MFSRAYLDRAHRARLRLRPVVVIRRSVVRSWTWTTTSLVGRSCVVGRSIREVGRSVGRPSVRPSVRPTNRPTDQPTDRPSDRPPSGFDSSRLVYRRRDRIRVDVDAFDSPFDSLHEIEIEFEIEFDRIDRSNASSRITFREHSNNARARARARSHGDRVSAIASARDVTRATSRAHTIAIDVVNDAFHRFLHSSRDRTACDGERERARARASDRVG